MACGNLIPVRKGQTEAIAHLTDAVLPVKLDLITALAVGYIRSIDLRHIRHTQNIRTDHVVRHVHLITLVQIKESVEATGQTVVQEPEVETETHLLTAGP